MTFRYINRSVIVFFVAAMLLSAAAGATADELLSAGLLIGWMWPDSWNRR